MLTFLLCLAAASADEPADTVAVIRTRWEAVTAGRGAHCEALEETGEVRRWLHLDWNPDERSWPAVGNYTEQLDLYKTWCHPAFEGPVVKAVHRTTVAASVQSELTVLYDDAGQPRFLLQTGPTQPEVRAYFDGPRAVRLISRFDGRDETLDQLPPAMAIYAEQLRVLASALATPPGQPPRVPDHPWAAGP